MVRSKLAGRDCFADQYGTKYLFGKGGYIDELDGVIIAHITVDRYKLADCSYGDLATAPQEIIVTPAGLKGMCKHLDVPNKLALQRGYKSYKTLCTTTCKHLATQI